MLTIQDKYKIVFERINKIYDKNNKLYEHKKYKFKILEEEYMKLSELKKEDFRLMTMNEMEIFRKSPRPPVDIFE